MKVWKHVVKSFAILGLVLMVASCGSEQKKTDPSSPPPSGGSGGNGDPKTDTCVVPAPAAGTIVYYAGATGTGTAFPDANASYIGKIVTIFRNGTVEVDWDLLTDNKVSSFASLMPEGKCDPDVTGRRVIYTGPQGTAQVKFPSSSGVYLGKIVRVFSGSFAEIDWDHLTENVVVPFDKISLQAQ